VRSRGECERVSKGTLYFGTKNSNEFIMHIVVYYKQDAIKSENRDDVTETLLGSPQGRRI
jgi:hypothetical protein